MESYLLDWANLLLRWVHVITAIAWVGSSFYFVFLDSSLTPPVDEDLKRQGVSGELWAVHGGGFYHPVKFNVSPPNLPGHLHWFYWEAYSTWNMLPNRTSADARAGSAARRRTSPDGRSRRRARPTARRSRPGAA